MGNFYETSISGFTHDWQIAAWKWWFGQLWRFQHKSFSFIVRFPDSCPCLKLSLLDSAFDNFSTSTWYFFWCSLSFSMNSPSFSFFYVRTPCFCLSDFVSLENSSKRNSPDNFFKMELDLVICVTSIVHSKLTISTCFCKELHPL